MHQVITDDLDALLEALPPHIYEPLKHHPKLQDLLEVVMDLGRAPQARFPGEEFVLSSREITPEDVEYVTARIGNFGDDNRAGITRTLHRISAIRNRQGSIVGLTLRVGRAVFGTVRVIKDLVESGKSTLLLGRPGIGKTTMLREAARVLAGDLSKRVIIVDTSNEIAGDGDIPHPGIGHARRMQVPTPALQHAVMIEAVENHMPEVIVIDEIGTELESIAARTIAERGVQLIGTAHGNTLDNLIANPTLSDLIGGIHTVTLSDEEARRRGTQKSVLERKAPPTFDVVVEIQERNRVAVHPDVATVVDAMLRGQPPAPEIRWLDEEGEVRISRATPAARKAAARPARPVSSRAEGTIKIFPFGINRGRLEQTARELQLPAISVDNPAEADLLVTSKSYYRRKPQPVRDAEAAGLPIYVLKSNTPAQIRQCLSSIATSRRTDFMEAALREAEEAASQVAEGEEVVELSPQSAFIRRLQHQIAERHRLASSSLGKEPNRRVRIFRGGE